jgi:hypothetical protein
MMTRREVTAGILAGAGLPGAVATGGGSEAALPAPGLAGACP